MNHQLIFRLATKHDLADIARMLSDGPLGAAREKFSETLSVNYIKAFNAIHADLDQELTVIEENGTKSPHAT
jgi:hypothetical protein